MNKKTVEELNVDGEEKFLGLLTRMKNVLSFLVNLKFFEECYFWEQTDNETNLFNDSNALLSKTNDGDFWDKMDNYTEQIKSPTKY